MTVSDKTPKRGKAPPPAGGAAKASTTRPKEQQEQTTAKAGKKRTENKAARKAENKGVARYAYSKLKNGRAFLSLFVVFFPLYFPFDLLNLNRLAKHLLSRSSKKNTRSKFARIFTPKFGLMKHGETAARKGAKRTSKTDPKTRNK